jgi:hypothetical protein
MARLDDQQRAAETAFKRIGSDELDQGLPWHHALHVIHNPALARALPAQRQAQVGLLFD